MQVTSETMFESGIAAVTTTSVTGIPLQVEAFMMTQVREIYVSLVEM